MHLNLTTPRPSTIVLLGLLIALLTSTPVPLAVLVAVTVWACHTPVALLLGVLAVLAHKATHPKPVTR